MKYFKKSRLSDSLINRLTTKKYNGIPAPKVREFLELLKIQEEQKITVGFWVLLGSVMTACCLASTMGALLACMLVGTAGLCGAVSYRKWKLILPLIGCCIPCIVYAGMYLLLG